MARHRSKKRNIYRKRKSPLKKVIMTLLSIVVVFGLVFVGYSVAEPIFNFFKNNNNSDSSSLPWEPSPDISASTSESESEDTSTLPPVDTTKLVSIEVTDQVLGDEKKLTEFLDSAVKGGYNSVIITLKVEGGELRYKSSVDLAIKAGAVKSERNLTEIVTLIKSKNLTPVARIYTLTDHLAPKYNKNAGYLFATGASSWYDNSVDKGGKPWLSPFSDVAIQYLCDISKEISDAGVEKLIVADVIFPPFRNSDLEYIGEKVKDTNRYKRLIRVVEAINETVKANTETILEVSVSEVLAGTSEVFVPAELGSYKISAEYNSSDFKDSIDVNGSPISLKDMSVYDKATTILSAFKTKSGTLEISPFINKEGLSDADLQDVIRAITDLEFKSYTVK